MNKIHIGTSGWSYKHWNGIFYPEEVKADKYLEYFITEFNCVELNSSFYHLPLKSTVEGWMKRTPENFTFCPKLSRFITHQRRLVNIEEPLSRFFGIFDIMKSRMGPVLIQLPPGLPFDKLKASAFFEILTRIYSEYRYAIEIRHKSWLSDEAFSLLEKHGIAFTIADSGDRYPYYERITTDFIYIRFHGNGQLYASDYSNDELEQYAKKILAWNEKIKEIWIFFNNDINGYAIKNAMKLRELINGVEFPTK
jgi:uncharacterized protein YecE (DUF72 family)